MLSNTFDEESEPDADDRTAIMFDELRKLIGRSFGTVKPQFFMALLKRCVVMVAGEHGFYLRLPGEGEDLPIHRFADRCLRKAAMSRTLRSSRTAIGGAGSWKSRTRWKESSNR